MQKHHPALHLRILLACSLLLATGAASSAAPTPATPAMLANACAGCHGTLGVSVGKSIPSLAGQSKSSLVDAMQGFKNGARPSTVMGRIVRGYSDDEISAIAGYFAAQTMTTTAATAGAKKP